ncbi:restriction endonuclease subunit S [Candidatus Parabeggiatoa sp. HSG14]|uniref:restriction endonuclease subunit S n=1 Tax=Candidatus Parabeggiatoa sp. HSG14 TaxID=3055593 RepID=UPI0025A85D3A|nr:restriction endonuclease subunit S [Thiotrichales bacterium HSG14]
MREDWIEIPLGDVFHTTSGGTPSRKKSEYYTGNIPWVKSGELENNVILDTEEKITEEALKNSSAKLFSSGTLLLALYGATIGKLAFLGIEACTNQAICGIFDNGIILSKYTFYFLLFRKPKLIQQGAGGAQPNISQNIVRKQLFPLIPLPKQRAIVSKIEQLFSELDNGIANLKAAKDKLEIYRQAVLKKAFEGELTKKWREKQKDLPTADELLEQIKSEREAHYAKQLEEWQKKVKEWEVNGKEGRKLAKPKEQKELPPLTNNELKTLSSLPEGWSWCKINEVIKCLDNLRKPINKQERQKRIGNIPYYGANGQVGWIDDYIFNDELVIVVEDETFTGRKIPFSYKISGKSWVNNHAHVLKNELQLNVNYLNYSLMFYPFTQLTTGTTGRKKLTQFALNNAPYYLCSLEEQTQIVKEIETRLSVCDNISATIDDSLEKAKALRQSILKKAFEGKLLNATELEACRQEPDWEPADKLLARIKQSRITKKGKND